MRRANGSYRSSVKNAPAGFGSGRNERRDPDGQGAARRLVVFEGTREQGLLDPVPDQGLQRAPRIALTFDDGPSGWTPGILRCLEKHDAKATFFVVGDHIPGREHLLQRIQTAGCEVGNHTRSHADLSRLSNHDVILELADCSLAVQRAGLPTPTVYRAPFLNDTPEARVAGIALGMVSVGCDVIPEDWKEPDPRNITNRILAEVRDGSVVLLHDGVPSDRHGSRDATVAAVRELVPELLRRGFELVTVSEL